MFSLTILVNQKDDNYTRTPSGLTIGTLLKIFDPLNIIKQEEFFYVMILY
jgi:hypothetical protein